MFVTGPPGEGCGGLRVSAAAHRAFDGHSELATDPSLRAYLSDMVAPFGLALREELFAEGVGHSYGDMAEPLIGSLVPGGDRVDLLVLAHRLHDIRLGRATATYLGSRCPGDPLAFAVCDQGVAAAFSALQLIQAYAATGACRRAMLLIVEQTALHYELSEPVPMPALHTAVGLLLDDPAGTAPATVRVRGAVAAQRVSGVLESELAGLCGGRSDVTVILGNGLAAEPAPASVVRAPVGQPFTGVWWELSRGLAEWSRQGRLVVMADYDASLEYLCVAAADFADPLTKKGMHHGYSYIGPASP
jgi:hypothetical protein